MIEAKGSLGNKFTYSLGMISMSCWFVTNALVLYPIEIKLKNDCFFKLVLLQFPISKTLDGEL